MLKERICNLFVQFNFRPVLYQIKDHYTIFLQNALVYGNMFYLQNAKKILRLSAQRYSFSFELQKQVSADFILDYTVLPLNSNFIPQINFLIHYRPILPIYIIRR